MAIELRLMSVAADVVELLNPTVFAWTQLGPLFLEWRQWTLRVCAGEHLWNHWNLVWLSVEALQWPCFQHRSLQEDQVATGVDHAPQQLLVHLVLSAP